MNVRKYVLPVAQTLFALISMADSTAPVRVDSLEMGLTAMVFIYSLTFLVLSY